MAGSILKVMGMPGTLSGAGASGSVGCGPGMLKQDVSKPVVLFDCPADFKSGSSLEENEQTRIGRCNF